MLTFAQFLADAARKGQAVNTLFDERLFDLVGILHKIAGILSSEDIPYELIGGLAVLIHVEEANPEHSILTRDVNLMVRRADLERIQETAACNGFRFRHADGSDVLVYGSTDSAKNAVHLLFTGEKVRPNQVIRNPPIAPQRKSIHGEEVFVISVADLVTMKLSYYRDKDRVHIRSLDAAGLITREIENEVTPELLARLQHIRETE